MSRGGSGPNPEMAGLSDGDRQMMRIKPQENKSTEERLSNKDRLESIDERLDTLKRSGEFDKSVTFKTLLEHLDAVGRLNAYDQSPESNWSLVESGLTPLIDKLERAVGHLSDKTLRIEEVEALTASVNHYNDAMRRHPQREAAQARRRLFS